MNPAGLAKILHPAFQLDGFKPGATVAEIEVLRGVAAVPPPSDYLNIIREMTDAELLVGGKKYLRIWGPMRCIEMNEAYEIPRRIPRSLAIGDDEGGFAFILMDGSSGSGLYKVDLSVLDAGDAEFLAANLGDLLVKGIGWEAV